MRKEKTDITCYDDGDFVINFKPRYKTKIKSKAKISSVKRGDVGIVDISKDIDNNYENLELTTKLTELICDYLVKNGKCQDGNCDNCINKQAMEIVKLSDISN